MRSTSGYGYAGPVYGEYPYDYYDGGGPVCVYPAPHDLGRHILRFDRHHLHDRGRRQGWLLAFAPNQATCR